MRIQIYVEGGVSREDNNEREGREVDLVLTQILPLPGSPFLRTRSTGINK